jgi:small subunit ribosomal protein S6
MSNKYEAMYIIDAIIEEEARKGIVEKFSAIVTDNGGTITSIDDWGKRRLAYPIEKKNEGYYVLMHFEAAPELPRELERNLQISEDIMRYLVIRR